MQHDFCVVYNDVRIRQICEEDIEQIRLWRNKEDISRYLRPIGKITPAMQKKWFENYLEDRNNITFAIEEIKILNKMVGTVSLYDFNGEESNCGKTVIGDPDARGKNLGFWGEVLALHVGFQKLGIEFYKTEVDQENIVSQKMTAKLGFKKVSFRPLEYRIGNEDQFRMTREEFYQLHPFLQTVPIYEG